MCVYACACVQCMCVCVSGVGSGVVGLCRGVGPGGGVSYAFCCSNPTFHTLACSHFRFGSREIVPSHTRCTHTVRMISHTHGGTGRPTTRRSSVLPPVITSLATALNIRHDLRSPWPLLGSGRALTGPGRLARSGALGIRVDAGSGPGAGGGSGNRRCRHQQCVTQIRLDRLARLACRSTV